MTRQEILDWQVDACHGSREAAMHHARVAMQAVGIDGSAQQMRRRWPVGCVALEITQRCNLDCTLCYLSEHSEHSEATRDIPLEEIFRRIDRMQVQWGSGVDVQVSGGNPTLRRYGWWMAASGIRCRPTEGFT